MNEYVPYITRDGDRWDQIALAHYGDVFAYERIIRANPTVPITPTLRGGIRLAIPIVAATTATVAANQLPPWKRSQQ